MSRRPPPHSSDAEASVLGGIMLRPAVFDEVSLVADDFWEPRHAHVWRAMTDLHEKGRAIDITTLEEHLRAAEHLARIGGAAYLGELVSKVATAANIGHYANIVRDHSRVRRVIEAAWKIADAGFATTDAREYLDQAQAILYEACTMAADSDGIEPAKALMMRLFKTLETRAEKRESITGIPTGYAKLDEMLCGLQDSDLVIVAGRPGTGKTAWAMSTVLNCTTVEDPAAALVFSLEMSREQLAERALSTGASVDSQTLRRGTMTRSEWASIQHHGHPIGRAPWYVDSTPALTITEMRRRARRWRADARRGGATRRAVVVVDYLQLARASKDHGNREQEVSEVSRGLKALAKELNCPVVALAQLNRKLEERKDKRPMLSDLRESGSIEADADVILFIYRDEIYDENSKDKGVAEVIIGKQRNGPLATVRLAFDPRYTKFSNPSTRRFNEV